MLYLNNKIIPEKNALISVFDHGFLYGDGIYETLRAYQGIVFMFEEHLERLFRSGSMISLKMPKTPGAIKNAVYKTMQVNGHKDAVIRISISRGRGPVGLDPGLCPAPTFVIMSWKFKEYPENYYKKGIRIAVVDTRRNFRGALNPQIKSLNFLNNILAKIEAKERGSYEAVMLNYRGYLAEGTITNIFFVKDDTLCTPGIDVGILDGITRKVIIDAAKNLGIRVKEGRFRKEDLYHAREVFISNTTMEIMPVAAVDNIRIGTGPGKITKALHVAYKKSVDEHIESAEAGKHRSGQAGKPFAASSLHHF